MNPIATIGLFLPLYAIHVGIEQDDIDFVNAALHAERAEDVYREFDGIIYDNYVGEWTAARREGRRGGSGR